MWFLVSLVKTDFKFFLVPFLWNCLRLGWTLSVWRSLISQLIGFLYLIHNFIKCRNIDAWIYLSRYWLNFKWLYDTFLFLYLINLLSFNWTFALFMTNLSHWNIVYIIYYEIFVLWKISLLIFFQLIPNVMRKCWFFR